MILFTSKVAQRHRILLDRSLCRRGVGSVVDLRMAHESDHLRMAPLRIRPYAVVEGHSGHLGMRLVVVGSRRLVGGRRVEDRIGRRVGHRSSRVVVEYGGGSHRGEGCSHVVDHGDRSSRHHLVVGHRSHHGHGSHLVSEIGNVRVVVESRFEADGGK